MRAVSRLSHRLLPLLLLTTISMPPLAWCASEPTKNEEEFDSMHPFLEAHKLPKNGATKLAVQYDQTDVNKPMYVLQGLTGNKIVWSKSVPDPDGVSPVQNITAEAVGPSKIKVTKFVHYSGEFNYFRWDGKEFKYLSQQADETPQKNVKFLYDTIGSGKLKSQDYYNNVGENFSQIWRLTNRKEITAMIKRADATAMKEYKAGRLDQAITRESAALTTATDILRSVCFSENIPIEDSTDDVDACSKPLFWLKVFQKVHVKPNVWQDERTYFPPSSYINAVNNYAFFLQLKGEHAKAIPIFQKIIAIDPDRSVNYLNLGDSLFAIGSKKEALVAYKNYEQHLDKHTIIPERVIERLNENL